MNVAAPDASLLSGLVDCVDDVGRTWIVGR
jgi:hypothetical protein